MIIQDAVAHRSVR